MDNYPFEAAIFDLDGVVTRTATVHSSAWKKTFDEYLRLREKRDGEPFREFTYENDYLPYVDGIPRYKGVQKFLLSRGIDIDFGDPSDPSDMETCCGIGNKKNDMFRQVLKEDGAEIFQSSVDLILEMRAAGIRIGMASSSKNATFILESAGLLDLFERFAQQHLDGIELGDIEWYHRIRNQLYHEGNGITVEKQQVDAYYQIVKILIENLYGEEGAEEPSREIDDSATRLGLFIQKWALLDMKLRSKAKECLPKDKHRTGPLNAIVDALYPKGIDLRSIRKDLTTLSEIRNSIVHTGTGSEEILEGSIKKTDAILNKLGEVA